MTKAILDSSFLVALIDEKDKWRNTDVLIQKALKKKNTACISGLCGKRDDQRYCKEA